MPRPYKKKTDNQKLRAEADKLWSQAIFKKANGKCEKCGKDGEHYKMDAHHIFGRKTLRHALENGVLLCFVCHRTNAHGSSYKDQETFHIWVREYLGDQFDIIYARASEYRKPDYRMACIVLQAYLDGK